MNFDKAQTSVVGLVVFLLTILQYTDTKSGLEMLIITILIVALAITPAIAMFSKKVFWIYWLLVGVGTLAVTLKFFHVF
jgi:hypothetical protein